MGTPISKAVCLTLLHGTVAVGFYLAAIACSYAMPPGMEPERISHYDPEAVPKGVPSDLPTITDPNGMRDTFFYPDGIGTGRPVHMRFPQGFVSSIFGDILPRHSDHLVFLIMYPELISIATPDIWREMHKQGGYIPDNEVEVGIVRPSRDYLTNRAARFLSGVEESKKKYPIVRFEVLPIPDGFGAPSCDGCREKGLQKIITYRGDSGINFPNNQEIQDTYVEWDSQGDATRFMQCMHTPRPYCIFDARYGKGNEFYNLSITFHEKLLDKLPGVIDRISKLINSSVVEK